MPRKAVIRAAALAGAAALAVSVAAPANAAAHGSGAATSTTHQAKAAVKTVTPQQAAKAVAFAAQQQGKPYMYGATGPDSFDSPGLTQAAYAAAGVGIPRTSQEQWQRSTHLTASQVRKGDLVFFVNGDHVGIVADAEKHLMIHAPRVGTTVRYESYDDNPLFTGFGRP
ncbi:C40 family peptidase [Streptomyces sp. UNOC14_S4]|nr:C40 family peptidase [Streptomyces sp. UNOC14_S4]